VSRFVECWHVAVDRDCNMLVRASGVAQSGQGYDQRRCESRVQGQDIPFPVSCSLSIPRSRFASSRSECCPYIQMRSLIKTSPVNARDKFTEECRETLRILL